jgi:hypothetical protein
LFDSTDHVKNDEKDKTLCTHEQNGRCTCPSLLESKKKMLVENKKSV